jgi:tRNA threonylcarbamoyladenosine biosynthesis protein TsaB
MLRDKKVYFFGDGAEKCKLMLAHQPNAVFVDHVFPSAAAMISLAEEKFRIPGFKGEDVALVEPFYLKEFNDEKKIRR